MDTIFAEASAPGRAGVSVIRISGPDALTIGERMAGSLPGPGRFALRPLRRGDGEVIDRALVLAFRAPASFTGEDVVEYQCHGSRAVVRAVLDELSRMPGARSAESGEFTRRALENDRMDLSEVEGLADLIDAETEAQRVLAMRVFSGGLGRVVEELRAKLLRAAALVEATIDFADEEVPQDVTPEVAELIGAADALLMREIAGSHVAERLRDGFEVAIIGRPNAGKSTLLNAIAGRDVALTSEIAGTTRDVIEVRTDLRGLPVTFLDTAGLRVSEDHVERLGVERARARADAADLRLFLKVDPDDTPELPLKAGDISILGKADLHGGRGVSGLTGEGVGRLLEQVTAELEARAGQAETAMRARHREAMEAAKEALGRARNELEDPFGQAEIVAESLREATRRLDGLIGRLGVEDVLGEIFASFCIGK